MHTFLEVHGDVPKPVRLEMGWAGAQLGRAIAQTRRVVLFEQTAGFLVSQDINVPQWKGKNKALTSSRDSR